MEVTKCLVFLVIVCNVMKINGFSWKHCPGHYHRGQNGLHFKKFRLSPDPLRLPGKIFINFDVEVTRNIVPPVSFEVRIWKLTKVFWFTTKTRIPGCCSYDDICKSLGVGSSGFTCSDELLVNCIDCTCPPTPGFYNTSKGSFSVNVGEIPYYLSFFANGKVETRFILKDGNGDLLECLEAGLTFQTARKRRALHLDKKLAHERKNKRPAYGMMPKYCYPEEKEATTTMLPTTYESLNSSFTTIQMLESFEEDFEETFHNL